MLAVLAGALYLIYFTNEQLVKVSTCTMVCFYFWMILASSFFFFSVRLLSVPRGHSVFSSPPQRPMTSDFEWFSIPDFIPKQKQCSGPQVRLMSLSSGLTQKGNMLAKVGSIWEQWFCIGCIYLFQLLKSKVLTNGIV